MVFTQLTLLSSMITLALAFSAIIPPAPGCTTLLPIYPTPASNSSAVYTSTITTTSTVDCNGCSLVSSTFTYPAEATGLAFANRTTSAASTSTIYSCLTPSPSPSVTLSSVPPPAPSPTAVLLPQSAEAQALLFALRSVLMTAQLLAADGFPADICGGLNPLSLDSFAINGTLVQDTICEAGSLQEYNPTLYTRTVNGNGDSFKYAEAAIFAVTAVGVGGNITAQQRQDLCNSVDEVVLADIGPRVKAFVCGT